MRLAALAAAATGAVGVLAMPGPAAAEARDAAVPTQRAAPWPSMRHDVRNTGRAVIRATSHPADPSWTLVTGKGIFSTPVVGRDETVYVGTTDTRFYAVGRRGRLRCGVRVHVITGVYPLGSRVR